MEIDDLPGTEAVKQQKRIMVNDLFERADVLIEMGIISPEQYNEALREASIPALSALVQRAEGMAVTLK